MDAAAFPPPPIPIPAEHILLEVVTEGVPRDYRLVPRGQLYDIISSPNYFRLWAETMLYDRYQVIRSRGEVVNEHGCYVVKRIGDSQVIELAGVWQDTQNLDICYAIVRNRIMWQDEVGQWFEFRDEDWSFIGLVGSRIILSPGTQVLRVEFPPPASPPAGP